MSSSAASFRTAPIYTHSPTSSVHTVTITTKEKFVEAGPDDVDIQLVNGGLQHVGPPPPSPPASVDREEVELASAFPPPIQQQPALLKPRLSTSSHQTLRAIVTSSPIEESPLPQENYLQLPVASSSSSAHQPQQQAPAHRPARRNTTGSTPSSPKHRRFHTQHKASAGSQTFAYDDGALVGEGSKELAEDIEQHADQIRRERMSKRFKQQQQEAEATLTRQASKASQQDRPLVGNLIGEGHVNYVLMYNMLTGIRVGVSRCQAKIKRPLTDDDFTARHKFSFDIVGNELTPSAKYDFKFKDYAPWVFRTLREDHFQIDPADYLLSLTSKYILSELGSPGKSGSFFYFSRDYRFIIKTIRHAEHKFLLKILKQYYTHIQENPHTLLSRFYGLHRVKLPRGRKIHFVIMNNLFPPHKDVHETYDLKGSTVGREYPEDKAAQNPRAVLKDNNWIKRGKKLEIGPEKRALLTEQLRRDSEFLERISVMDYSLLIGIHNLKRGNRDNVRRNTLKVFSPDLPNASSIRSSIKSQAKVGAHSPEAIAIRKAMRSSDPKRLGEPSRTGVDDSSSFHLPEEDDHRQQCLFYQDEGGLRATDENDQPMGGTIYYLGVIDILTPYNWVKKMEHVWKGMKDDIHKISPVPPPEYAERFFSFMKGIMRGGELDERFKVE
ncbi:hypothetical protein D9611_010588 [Ephemerocybe angulata]|uniref:1-phosphatidylinositol-4-phosphate 5-kinase n=1 Tax=Ephemerocybe angulata TaxID=980116 RepID=A0A8H5BW93_9AGAR|nr:hypothetical protein D9611_010588 [Tulosesus angulatus]